MAGKLTHKFRNPTNLEEAIALAKAINEGNFVLELGDERDNGGGNAKLVSSSLAEHQQLRTVTLS